MFQHCSYLNTASRLPTVSLLCGFSGLKLVIGAVTGVLCCWWGEQVNVSLEPPAVEDAGGSGEGTLAAMVEPYRGRPQLKGMRVRAKPAGAGSGNSKRLKFVTVVTRTA